jgi:hypothetical protein
VKVGKSGRMAIDGVVEGEWLKVVGKGCSAKAAASLLTGLAWRSPSCGCEEQCERMLWPVRTSKEMLGIMPLA